MPKMMNKFRFLLEQESLTADVVAQHIIPYKDFHKIYDFQFVSEENTVRDLRYDLITGEPYERRGPGMIDKSAIQENVAKQLKTMKSEIASCGETLLYLRMNKVTKNLFRMYHSYEVDLVPKNLNNIDKTVGKIVGNIVGIKIVQDESIKTYRVQPVVSREVKKKFEKIF